MDDLEAEPLVALPEEPRELLELLQDILSTFRKHLKGRFEHDGERTLTRRHLNTRIQQLDMELENFMDQPPQINQELYNAAYQVALRLNSTLHARRIQDILEHDNAHYCPPRACPGEVERNFAFANLEKFRLFIWQIPEGKQTINNQHSLIKAINEAGIELLSSHVSKFTELLRRENPESHQAPVDFDRQKARYRWSSERDFQFYPLRCRGHLNLHDLLRNHWPCACGADHENKLGGCMNIMLCLQSRWTHPQLAIEEYNMILQHEPAPINCNIVFQEHCSTTPLTTGKLPHPSCQALFDSIQGFRLKIIATQGDSDRFDAEIFPDQVVSYELGKPVSLQKVLQERIILRLRERRILAVVLMYSFMQLLGGPWLQEYWDSADISFYQFDGNKSSETFNFRRPYLSACWIAAQGRTRPTKLHEGYHPMPDMVTLARFLLELELQEYIVPRDLTQDLNSNLPKASRLLRRVKELDRDQWAKACFVDSMKACLAIGTYDNYNPQNPERGLWDIYQKVISPLEQNLCFMLGPDATFEDLERELSGATPLANVTYGEPPIMGQTENSPISTESEKWFMQLKQQTHTLMKHIKDGEVKVAILDTGIDLQHPLLRGRVSGENCWDFVQGNEYICDDVGHGTHTTYLLANTAPQAKIFCGRVWKTRNEDDNTCRLIADGIRKAVQEWEVDIIVMPFAFPQTSIPIKHAIADYSNKVLFFAAACNYTDGKLGFPANRQDVFCIFSNKTRTIPSTFCRLGKPKESNFSAIGEEVLGAWPTNLSKRQSQQHMERDSGTSCSTPIAAGVAALILHFAKQSGRIDEDRLEDLRKKAAMEKIMFECMTDKYDCGRYNLLEPWKLLSMLDGKQKRTIPSMAAMISHWVDDVFPN